MACLAAALDNKWIVDSADPGCNEGYRAVKKALGEELKWSIGAVAWCTCAVVDVSGAFPKMTNPFLLPHGWGKIVKVELECGVTLLDHGER